MSENEFGYPSDEEIWEKISSDDINARVEGLLAAARKVGFEEKNPRQAFNYLETARVLADEVGDYAGLAHCYQLIGAMHSKLSEWVLCAESHLAGADAGKRSFRADLEIDHLMYAGRAFRRVGNNQAARENFSLAIAIAGESKYWFLPMLQVEYGRFLRKMGELDLARTVLEEAYADEAEYPSSYAGAELVSLYLAAGENGLALSTAREAVASAHYSENGTLGAKALFGVADALIRMGQYQEALDELASMSLVGVSTKHKVRVDMLRASAMAGLGDATGAIGVLGKALPMLRRLKLWESYADGLAVRAAHHLALDNHLDAQADLVSALEVYETNGLYEQVSLTQLKLAEHAVAVEDWANAAHYAGAVVDNVLQMFSPWYVDALGLCALAKAKLGDFEASGLLADRILEIEKASGSGVVDSVPGDALGHAYFAKALELGGVKGKNLAVKAVKAYLSVGAGALATDASELV